MEKGWAAGGEKRVVSRYKVWQEGEVDDNDANEGRGREREGKEGREGGREERRNYQKVSVEPPQRYRTVVLKQRDM